MRHSVISAALLFVVFMIIGCGGGGGTSDTTTWTLRVEVTSSGKNIAWTGSVTASSSNAVHPSAAAPTTEVAIGGITPFAQDIQVSVKDCSGFACTSHFTVDVTKSVAGPERLTLCVWVVGAGKRECATPPCLSCDDHTTTLFIMVG